MAVYTFSAPSNGYQFRITLTDSGINYPADTSTVDWVIEHYQASTKYTGTMNRFLTVNGTNVYSVNGSYDTTPYGYSSWWTVASGTSAAITHDSSGAATISIRFYWSGTAGGFGPGTVDQTWSFALVDLTTTPTVTTNSISNIDTTSGFGGGNVTFAGNGTVSERGICYSLTTAPTIASSKVISGSGTGTFTATMTGLVPDTTYYVRAYATNEVATGYGTEVSFKTLTSGFLAILLSL